MSAVRDLNRAINLRILHAVHIPSLLRLELAILLLDVCQPLKVTRQSHVGRSVLRNLLLEALRPVGPVRRRLIGLFCGHFDTGLDGHDLLLHINDVLDALLLYTLGLSRRTGAVGNLLRTLDIRALVQGFLWRVLPVGCYDRSKFL